VSETPTDRAVPDDWAEVSNPDYIVEKYDPRAPTLFEYDERGDGGRVEIAKPPRATP
jgi:hypothetical protein